jgi:hypothetical protein
MAIFASNTIKTTSVTTSAVKVFDSASAAFATGAKLTGLTIMNVGSVTAFIGIASVTTTGLRLAPGQQVTYNDAYSYVKGDTTGDVYAITASGTTIIETGLATVNSDV